MILPFKAIRIETAPRSWQDIVASTRSEVIHPANVGLQAVVYAFLSSDRTFDRNPLFVPLKTDRRCLDLNPDLRAIRRSNGELIWLGAGVASLILTQGVSRLLNDLTTFNVDRDDGQGSIFKRMPVPDEGNKRISCARMIGEEVGQVTDFTVSWQPGASGELNSGIEVAATIEKGSVDSRSVVLDSSTVGHGVITIIAKQGVTVERIPRLEDTHSDAIEAMGQSLLIATSLM